MGRRFDCTTADAGPCEMHSWVKAIAKSTFEAANGTGTDWLRHCCPTYFDIGLLSDIL